VTWSLDDINPPESEALQAEREMWDAIATPSTASVKEDSVARHMGKNWTAEQHVADNHCDRCTTEGELYHDEASGLALCDSCTTAAAQDVPTRFKRLRNRAWGVSGPSALLQEGATIDVTKRDGTTTTVTVGRVLWSDESKAIATISK
jgi:hypothetical protein